MKKNLFTLFFVGAGLFATSQTRMSLYEEFTGENCGPCASTNPGLNTLLSQPANAAKVIAIKWQVPIPSAPTTTWSLYQTDITEIDKRWKSVAAGGYGYLCASCSPTVNYINYAPQGRMDGQELTAFGITGPAGSQNHPGYLTSAAISSAQAQSTPFSININAAYNANYTNAVVSVTVQSSAAFSTTAALVYRLVLVERAVNFATAPGSNGEKDFYDPVRKSYPNIQSGTALPNTWTIGQTQTFTVNCPIPSYIHDLTQMAFVGFIQDEGSHVIWQAARTASVGALANDAKATVASVTSFSCSTTINPTIALLNQGVNAITAMTITPSIDGIPQTPFNWTGNIPASGTATITLGTYNATGGSHNLVLNITGVNSGDVNMANNSASTSFALVQTYFPAPVAETYTATLFPPTNWFMTNADNGSATWLRSTAGNVNTGSAKYDFYNNGAVGDVDELFLPPSDLTAVASPSITFDVAYAQYSNENDKLEVKVSTNCGNTWTTIYTKAGSTLMTSAAQTSAFTPSQPTQWRNEVVALPAAASNNASVLVKFVATSDYGNNMYIDNVNVGTAIATSIAKNNNVIGGVELYPNPSKGETNISINTTVAGIAKISVVNALGQLVFNKEVALNAGANTYQFDTKDFAAGVYNVIIESNSSSVVKKLTVTK